MTKKDNIPPFDGAPRSIAILKAAAKDLQPHLSLKAQAEQIEVWSLEKAKTAEGFRSISLDRRKWHKFVTRDATYRSNTPDLPIVAWAWFFEKHPYAIEPLWVTAPDYQPHVPNVLVPAMHTFLSPSEKSIDMKALNFLRGNYAVYRPSFINLDHIMVMAMECGIGDDPSRFAIEMAFYNDDDERKVEQVEGYAIPYEACILFQGRIKKSGAPFIFVMSGLPLNDEGTGYDRGDGTVLVGANGTTSSAYPIAMRRTNKNIIPQTYDAEEFKTEVRSHSEIMQFLQRGIVGWR